MSTEETRESLPEEGRSASRQGVVIAMVLSVVLALLVMAGVVGAILHVQTSDAMQAEIKALSEQLKTEQHTVEGLGVQIEALSRQMHSLQDDSTARLGEPETVNSGADVDQPPTPVAVPNGNPAKSVAKTEEIVVEKAKSPAPAARKRPAENCELIGKSPEEQAATLKRCVEIMDGVGKPAMH